MYINTHPHTHFKYKFPIKLSRNMLDACDLCSKQHVAPDCPYFSISSIIPDSPFLSRARQSVPSILALTTIDSNLHIVSTVLIAPATTFGPLVAPLQKDPPQYGHLLFAVWKHQKVSYYNIQDEHETNWMAFVPYGGDGANLKFVQHKEELFFLSTREIPPGQCLNVNYSDKYLSRLGKALENLSSPYLEGWLERIPTLKQILSSSTLLNKLVEPPKRSLKKPAKKKCAPNSGEQLKYEEFSDTEEAIIGEVDQGKGYLCKLCGASFSSSINLIQHVCEPFCSQCDQQFETRESYQAHPCPSQLPVYIEQYDSLKKDDTVFVCGVCSQTFPKNGYLIKRHMPLHTGQFTCHICGRWLRDLESLTNHIGVCSHVEELNSNNKVICTHCHQEFYDVTSYRSHQYKVQKPYECEGCGERFLKPNKLETHSCPGRLFYCHKCHKKFPSEEELEAHKECDVETPTPTTPFKCATCEAVMFSLGSLKSHQKIHEEKKFVCRVCDKRFHRKDLLQSHLYCHSDPTFQCTYCNKLLKTEKSLKVHLNIHTDTKKFKCQYCDKKFVQKCNLQKHLNLHVKAARETCPHCFKSFATKEYLNKHVAKHTQKKTFHCSICNHAFLKSSELRQHSRRFHKSKLYQCKYCQLKFKLIHQHLKLKHPEHQTEWSDECVVESMLVEAPKLEVTERQQEVTISTVVDNNDQQVLEDGEIIMSFSEQTEENNILLDNPGNGELSSGNIMLCLISGEQDANGNQILCEPDQIYFLETNLQ